LFFEGLATAPLPDGRGSDVSVATVRERSDDVRAATVRERGSDAYGEVPFLNGGLFEPTALDQRVQEVPYAALGGLIGNQGLFYRYNFTVEESTPLDIEVAVDPEMLGKVFEELVTGRHETGSYYTPRPVVSFMCREAIKGYLASKTKASPDAIATLVDQATVAGLTEAHGRQILEALDSLKAVDPACGSGAYLLGLLHELVAIYRLLISEKLVKDRRSLYDLKLRIISNNLYGVDIDPFATNIAMLRLWLSLEVEADEPLPLPNLDFKSETGDSLLGPDPRAESRTLQDHAALVKADVVLRLKEQYLRAHAELRHQYRDNIEAIEREIEALLEESHGEGVINWRVHFAEVFIRQTDFLGQTECMVRSSACRIGILRRSRRDTAAPRRAGGIGPADRGRGRPRRRRAGAGGGSQRAGLPSLRPEP
jgi:hypothetical protein